MPESAGPDRHRRVEALLDRLSRAVGTIDAHVGESRRRAQVSGDLEERLKALAAENRRLRETLAQAKSRAERLRNRLAHVEDEV